VSTEAKPDVPTSEAAEPPNLVETTAPSGMNLRPKPEEAVRISWKVGGILVGVAVALLCIFAYNGIARSNRKAAAALTGPQRKVEPARPDDVQQALTLATSPLNRPTLNPGPASIGGESAQLQPLLASQPNERVVMRAVPAQKPGPPVIAAHPDHEATPEERARAAAFASEQQARLAPTSIRTGTSSAWGGQTLTSPAQSDTAASLEALARTLGTDGSRNGRSLSQPSTTARADYDDQNLQGQKEGFLDKARLGNVREDYLKFTRIAPMSRFEIKAGWEIPAVLEQALNSDLPGELKALVMSNVYDTASGLYLLIPQGSRLIGGYNSRLSYGQNGVQVAWSRIIFPDASTINLNGMNGLDAHGNAGLREKVDRHYKQLFGFAVLTSMFDAALAITQNRQQSVLVYPSATQQAESAVGREVSQLGTEITRKNLNVQPTVKIPAGYKFNVRVNRDILFEEPYRPAGPNRSER